MVDDDDAAAENRRWWCDGCKRWIPAHEGDHDTNHHSGFRVGPAGRALTAARIGRKLPTT